MSVVVSVDSEEEDLQEAIRLSLLEQQEPDRSILLSRDPGNGHRQDISTSDQTNHVPGSRSHPRPSVPFYLNQLSPIGSPSPPRPAAGDPNVVTFDNLLGRLQAAWLTSFMVDADFVRSKFPRHLPVTLVRHWDRQGDKAGTIKVHGTLTVVQPPLGYMGCMHAKLMLLQFPEHLRVVISSANLTHEDWALISQTVWFHDFPLRKPPIHKASSGADGQPSSCNEAPHLNDFGEELRRFLRALTIDAEFTTPYDFSSTSAQLIASVPGSYTAASLHQYGHMRLRHLLRSSREAWPSDAAECDIEVQTSSLGQLTQQWIDEFIASAAPSPVASSNPKPTNKRKASSTSSVSNPCVASNSHGPCVRVVFPSLGTVRRSCLGPSGAGTIVLRSNYYTDPKFPRQVLCHLDPPCASRAGYLLHSKVVLRLATLHDNSQAGWCYNGSANFTASAWGRLQKAGTQLQCSNYELGVFVPIRLPPPPVTSTLPTSSPLLPLPFGRPLRLYGPLDTPWMLDMYNDQGGGSRPT